MPEAVIVSVARSPIGRANKGSLKDFRPDDLAALIVKTALDKIPALDRNTVDDLYLGCGLPGGEMGNNMGRIINVINDMDQVPGATITRYCASSVQTTRMAFHAIQAGQGDVVTPAGVDPVPPFKTDPSHHIPNPPHPTPVDDLYRGCGLPGGEMGNNMGRIINVINDMDQVPGATITRYCASSVQTTRMAFHAIKAGEGDVFISAGVETVSRFKNGTSDHIPNTRNPIFDDAIARTDAQAKGDGTTTADWHDPREDGLLPDAYIAMGQTAEHVARMRGLSRQGPDQSGVRSQNLAAKRPTNRSRAP